MLDKTLCNCMAQMHGLDPVGHAAPIQRLLALEVALPWKRNVLESLPAALQPVLARAKGMGGAISSTPWG